MKSNINLEKLKSDSTSLDEQAKIILQIAEASGVQSNYFFKTTFTRYQQKIEYIAKLQEAIDTEGPLVKKEYVKGRGNLYENPALRTFVTISDSANKDVATLIKIIRTFNVSTGDDGEEKDPIWDAINGGDENDGADQE